MLPLKEEPARAESKRLRLMRQGAPLSDSALQTSPLHGSSQKRQERNKR